MKAAIIGCGNISDIHVRSIINTGHELSYVCDIDENKAKRFDAEYVDDYHELLKKEVDVIHILTPHYLHVEMAIDCLQAGFHVVMEKPIGIHLEALEKLYRIQKCSKKRIGVVFQNRFNSCVRKLKDIIADEELGRFLGSKAIITWNRDEAYYHASWKGCQKTEGGGLLINQAIHTFDLLRYLVGDFSNYKGMISNFSHPTNDVEDTAFIEFDYKNGGKGIFMGTVNYVKNSSVELELVYEKHIFRYMDGKLLRDQETICLDDKSINKDYYGCGHEQCIQNIYNYFANIEPLLITFRDAMESNNVILDIYKELV